MARSRTRGASAVEYSIILVLVTITGVVGYKTFGKRARCLMLKAGTAFQGEGGASGGDDDCDAPAGGDSGGAGGPVADNSGPSTTVNCNACTVAGKCFVAGTPVLTEEGTLPIEAVRVGMRVWTRPDEGGAAEWKPVARTFMRVADALIRLTVAGDDGEEESIELTPSHRLQVQGRGWLEASALQPGRDQLVDATQRSLTVVAAESLAAAEPVFNLEIADDHTYFVGAHGVWAHNDCSGDSPPPPPTPPGGAGPSVGGGGSGSGSDGHAHDDAAAAAAAIEHINDTRKTVEDQGRIHVVASLDDLAQHFADTHPPATKDESLQRLNTNQARAFTASDGHIYVLDGPFKEHDVIHEVTHVASTSTTDGSGKTQINNQFGEQLNEGFTEYFAKQTVQHNGGEDAPAYPGPYKFVHDVVVPSVGAAKAKHAYLDDHGIAELASALATKWEANGPNIGKAIYKAGKNHDANVRQIIKQLELLDYGNPLIVKWWTNRGFPDFYTPPPPSP